MVRYDQIRLDMTRYGQIWLDMARIIYLSLPLSLPLSFLLPPPLPFAIILIFGLHCNFSPLLTHPLLHFSPTRDHTETCCLCKLLGELWKQLGHFVTGPAPQVAGPFCHGTCSRPRLLPPPSPIFGHIWSHLAISSHI